jgi:hypothetical protein
MQCVLRAIGMVAKVVAFTMVHVLIMLPLAFICWLLSFLLLPLDGVAYALSLGQLRLEIFWSFQTASKTVFSWYGRAVKGRE